MELDYFPGYEFMVFLLAWIIYIGFPVGSIWGVRQLFPNPKALLVSPVIALAALFVFRTFFLLISSKDSGIENVFIWHYQLVFSAAFLMLYGLYSKKTYLSKYISIMRLMSYLSSFCFGICVGKGTPVLLSLTIFSLDGLEGIRNPHQIAAGCFVLSLIPVVYFVLLYGIRRIQPMTFDLKNKMSCVALVVLGCLAFWFSGRLK